LEDELANEQRIRTCSQPRKSKDQDAGYHCRSLDQRMFRMRALEMSDASSWLTVC
jgi:hypothetical protein